MSYFNINEYEKALQSFRQAKKSKASFADARKREKYTLHELERLRALAASAFKLAEKTEETLQADENNLEAIGGNILKDEGSSNKSD